MTLVDRPHPAVLMRDITVWVILAAAFRLLFLLAVPPLLDSADALHYLRAAEQIGQGDFATLGSSIPILYPSIAGLLHALGIPAETACRIVSLLAGILVIIPYFLLSHRLFGLRAARMSTAIIAIWPWLADWSGRVAPEALAMLLWFSAVYALWRAMEGQRWAQWTAPWCFFALHLTRPEGTLLFLIAPVAALCLVYRQPKSFFLRLVPFFVTASLLLATQVVVSSFMGTGGTVNARFVPGKTLRYVFVNRFAELVETLSTVLTHNLPVMLGPILLALIGVGLFAIGLRPRKPRAEWYILTFAMAQAALAVLSTYSEPRYIMATVMALTVWAGRGVDVIVEGCEIRGRPRLGRIPALVVVASMLFGFVVTAAPEFTGRMPREPREYRIVGEWMREHCAPGLIVVRKPQVGYYAGMATTGPMPDHSVDRMVEWMRAIDARYLVVDERYGIQLNPALRPLLDPAQAPPALRLIADDLSPFPGARVVVYELVAP